MNFQEHRKIINGLKQQIESPPSYDILNVLLSELQYTMQDNPELGVDERKYIFTYSRFIKKWAAQQLSMTMNPDWDKLYWDAMLFEARNRVVDSYLIYLEKNRDPEDRFYEPRRKQLLELGYIQGLQDLIDDKLDILSISSVPGSGKEQPLYSKVLTPNGFICMGNVKVGTKVLTPCGDVASVTGVFPQGIKDIYRIYFNDGTSVDCGLEHLWKVQSRSDRRTGASRIVSLKDMLNHVRTGQDGRKNYSVDYIGHINFEKTFEIEVHPYVLGVLLGDGSLERCARFTNSESDIVDKVRKCISDSERVSCCSSKGNDYCIANNRRVTDELGHLVKSKTSMALEGYGLLGKRSYEKFIPQKYFNASFLERLELLRGLLDTDGYVAKSYIEYSTSSKKMSDDVVQLVRSLGGYATISGRTPVYTYLGESLKGLYSYRIIIQFPKDIVPVSSQKHLSRLDVKRKIIKKYIERIEPVGKAPCQCIMVDHKDHLYITDDYIVTHNTTLGEMFMSGFIGWYPDLCNLFSSHSGHVTRMVYKVLCNILGIGLKPAHIPEYAWREIFQDVEVESVSAEELEINLGKFKPFKSITCRALGASQTGVTRCEGILYCDDLCSGIEMALSKIRLDKLWTLYSTDLKTRKKKGRGGRTCKELHIATRWSVWDVIGRIMNIYQNNDRCRFISIPDINPKTGESNFDYDYGVGFDVAYFEDIEKSLDDITYKCLYKNEPVEREGILYNPDRLRRYYGDLPPKEPDAIWAFCDTKDTGTDYNCLGAFYQYGEDYYLHDVVFQSIDPYVLDDLNADCIVRNNVHIAVFESNKEGSRTGDKVHEKVKEKGGRAAIEKRFTTSNKETKIIVNSPWVIEHVLFKHSDYYEAKSDYGQFMSWLCAYSQLAKNPHDDAPDMVSMLAVYQSKGVVASVQVRPRPF